MVLQRMSARGSWDKVGGMAKLGTELLLGTLCWLIWNAPRVIADDRKAPGIEDYATVEAYTNGVPVYSFGNLAYIYGVSPDLLPGAIMQDGNTRPVVKIKPKKSWEIRHGSYGVNMPEPGPRTPWDDSQPLLPIHLIDGDPDTAWASHSSTVPDERPEWIRIDLPMETTVTAVVLVCSQDFAGAKLWEEGKLKDSMGYHEWGGRALPNELTIQVSRDAWHWEQVYQNKSFSGNDAGPSIIEFRPANELKSGARSRIVMGKKGATIIEFPPRRAKQILITGRNFKRRMDKWGYAFSLGEVEVRDTTGQNVALVSRGAGVTVSSTDYLMNQDRVTQDALWAPLVFDLGAKWARIGPDNGLYTWHAVEREKGKLQVDPVGDRAVTELAQNGVNIVMNLDVKGNYVYEGRKVDWRQARYREINNIYYDHPGWCWDSPAMMQAYLRYVDYMVRHFKDRVAYWEVGNEWMQRRSDVAPGGPLDIYEKALQAIKGVDPNARIMVCLYRMPDFPEWLKKIPKGKLDLFMPDAVGIHPTTRLDAGMTLDDLHNFYWEENRKAIKEATALGYKGIFGATEVYSWSTYPPGPRELNPDLPAVATYYGDSEMVRAKYLAQNFVGSAGLNMFALQCNHNLTTAHIGQSLLSAPDPIETVSAAQPAPAYYVERTLSTVMEDWRGVDFPVSFTSGKPFEVFTFQRGPNERMVAAWVPGNTVDGLVEAKSDVAIPGVHAAAAWGIDLLNGTRQELNFDSTGSDTVIRGIRVKDYPTLIEIRQ